MVKFDVDEILNDIETRRRDENFTNVIVDAITLALRPFKPSRIDLYLSDQYFPDTTLRVDVCWLPGQPIYKFECLMDDREEMLSANWIETMTLRISKLAFDHYRNLPREEPPANIILGEY